MHVGMCVRVSGGNEIAEQFCVMQGNYVCFETSTGLVPKFKL